MTSYVVAVVATHHRSQELARLLRSLEKSAHPLGGIVVVDNGAEAAVRQLVETCTISSRYVSSPQNLGCGGGLALGEKRALDSFRDKLTHLWMIDDDAVVEPDALALLLEAMSREKADLACPMVADSRGRIVLSPGVLDERKLRVLDTPQTPAQYIGKCGAEPALFSWSTGVALLVTQRAIAEVGFHRSDFWVRGEDFDFSLRITARRRGVFVPRATVHHVVPDVLGSETARENEYRKQCAMVQNVTFIGLHLPHGRRIRRHIAGRYYRHFQNWGVSRKTLWDAVKLFWQGAIMRRPAGHPALDWPMPRQTSAPAQLQRKTKSFQNRAASKSRRK